MDDITIDITAASCREQAAQNKARSEAANRKRALQKLIASIKTSTSLGQDSLMLRSGHDQPTQKDLNDPLIKDALVARGFRILKHKYSDNPVISWGESIPDWAVEVPR